VITRISQDRRRRYPEAVKAPKQCPVCGSEKLQKIALNGKLAKGPGGQRGTGPQSYRCENGHTFIVQKKNAAGTGS
jgi:NAD-dependent DNA ligase